MSSSADAGAERFVMLSMPYERSFTAEEMLALDNGVEARAMEDKWDIHQDGVNVFFRRSWSGQLFFVLPLDTTTMACTELHVDRNYMNMLDAVDMASEVVRVFELVLNHVVFQRPLEVPFVFGEQVQGELDLWAWIGSSCVPAAQRAPH